MKLQQLLNQTRKAIDDYHMIEPFDRIAIGISGGKDSLTLLYALANLKHFYPIPFTLEAISVDLGFQEMDYSLVEELCNKLQVPFTVVPTQIYEIVFQERKEGNPCSLCSKMRKGALNTKAKELSCNKIAYAHHKDDLIETFLMSQLFEGRINTFLPVTHLDRSQLDILRPLMYVKEADIIGFSKKQELPIIKSKCPADGYTNRTYAKQLIQQLNKEHPGVKERLFAAAVHGEVPCWPNKRSERRTKFIKKEEDLHERNNLP